MFLNVEFEWQREKDHWFLRAQDKIFWGQPSIATIYYDGKYTLSMPYNNYIVMNSLAEAIERAEAIMGFQLTK